MALNSMLMSSGTNNLIAMKKRRVDRSGYSEYVETWGLDKKVRCRSRLDLKDRNERYSVLSLSPFSSHCFLYNAAPSPSSPTASPSASAS